MRILIIITKIIFSQFEVKKKISLSSVKAKCLIDSKKSSFPNMNFSASGKIF